MKLVSLVFVVFEIWHSSSKFIFTCESSISSNPRSLLTVFIAFFLLKTKMLGIAITDKLNWLRFVL